MIKLHPSKGHIWGKNGGCTANPMMTSIIPKDDPGGDAKLGLAAHELAYDMNCAQARSPMYALKKEDVVGKMTSVGVSITEEMYEAVKVFTDDVQNHMVESRIFGGEDIGFEAALPIHSISKLCNGKVDAYLYDRTKKQLIVWDYKHGKNPVEAFEFTQGIIYAKGLIDKFNINGIEDQLTTVVIKVVQPNTYRKESVIDEWRVKASDLRSYFNILKHNAHKALHSPETVTGSHCGSCGARHSCEAALKAGMKHFEVATQPTPLNMSDEALSLQYSIVCRAVEMLKDLKSGYEQQIENKLRGGKSIPGYGLEPSYSRVKWVKPFDEVKKLGELLGHKLTKDELITPKQAEELGIDSAVIKQYSDKVKTGVKLVKIDNSKAKRIFS